MRMRGARGDAGLPWMWKKESIDAVWDVQVGISRRQGLLGPKSRSRLSFI